MSFFEFLEMTRIGSMSLSSILSALLLLVVCAAAIKVLTKAFNALMDKSKHLDPSLKSFFASSVKVVLWALAVMIIASSLGIPVTSLVALFSVAGVALSLALQGLLANLFSGITLLATRPFGVGDYVELGGEGGTVQSIGMFTTAILTADNKKVFVPNGDITSGKIINYSSEPLRRVDITVGASYDSATEDVRAALLEAAAMDEKVLAEPAPFAAILSYGASNIDYVVRAWCNCADYWDVYFRLNENIRTCFDKRGVQMSYDRLNVHMMTEE